MKKFTLGMVTGMSSLALAVPVIAQIASAQVDADASSEDAIPTQACVGAMADLEEAHLAQFDLMNEQRKQSIQTRITALNDAAAISDGATRKAALEEMRDAMKTQMESMKDSVPEELQTAMDAVKAECGDTFQLRIEGFKGDHPMLGKFIGRIPGQLAEKLGMTEDELKAAIDSGKTIPEIADEQGVELPAPPHGGRMIQFFHDEIDQ